MRSAHGSRSEAGKGGDAGGRRAVLGAMALGAILALAGCGDGGTPPEPRPSRLVRVSAAADTVLVNEAVDPPLSVRVEDSNGDPVGGVAVQFAILAGSGTFDPGTATSDGSGVARTVYVAGRSAGTTTLEARIPSASSVEPVQFEIVVRPPDAVNLSSVSGEGQTAEPGSQLPEEFRVRATSPSGTEVGGVPVVWEIADEPILGVAGEGASLTADTSFTDLDGEAYVLLTLSEAAGEHRVRAFVPARPDTVTFTATGDPGAVGDVVIDSVRPLPLRAGQTATIHGSGFAGSTATDTVLVEGVSATVREASAERIEFEVPAFEDRCLPERSVGVRVRTGGATSNGPVVGLVPTRAPLDLQPGEVRPITSPDQVRCLQLAAAGSDREYRFQVQSASRSAGANTPMRLIVRSGPEAGARPAVRLLESAVVSPVAGLADFPGLADVRHVRLRESAVREAIRVGARPARPEAATPGAQRLRFSHTKAPPEGGDTLEFVYSVQDNGTVSCTDTAGVITGVVREVGERVALVEDTLARQSSAHFTDADWSSLRASFDEVIFATDSAYFGAPTDIDHNERVIVLVTPEVNELTPDTARTLTTGFFNPVDLADSGDPGGDGTSASGVCPTSNEGEILYLLTPDPGGIWGKQVSHDGVLESVRGTSSHEFQHLLNTGIRLIEDGGTFGSSLMDTWLDEGLSHVAEEVVGLRRRGLRPRENHGWDAIATDETAFNAYFIQNFLRLREYWRDPSDTPAISAVDPPGTATLKMRGFAWIFLRWLADQEVPEGSGGFLGGPSEEAFFRDLVRGGPSQLGGTDDVLRAVELASGATPTWGELIADFSPMAQVDDDVAGVPERNTLPSWDVRDVFRELKAHSSTVTDDFPLEVEAIGFETAAYEFDLRGSTQRYFRLSASGEAPGLSLELASTSGGPVPSSAVPQITVVRVR